MFATLRRLRVHSGIPDRADVRRLEGTEDLRRRQRSHEGTDRALAVAPGGGADMYLTQSLHRNLQQNPDRPATICRDRIRTVAESVDRIAHLAGALAELGVQRGDRVGILSLNSDRYHEFLYAVAWVGAAVNPVNIRWSPAEIAYSLRESDTRVLFV